MPPAPEINFAHSLGEFEVEFLRTHAAEVPDLVWRCLKIAVTTWSIWEDDCSHPLFVLQASGPQQMTLLYYSPAELLTLGTTFTRMDLLHGTRCQVPPRISSTCSSIEVIRLNPCYKIQKAFPTLEVLKFFMLSESRSPFPNLLAEIPARREYHRRERFSLRAGSHTPAEGSALQPVPTFRLAFSREKNAGPFTSWCE